jgi:hypothetical protein
MQCLGVDDCIRVKLAIRMSDPSASLRVKFVEEAKQPDPFESGWCNLLFV